MLSTTTYSLAPGFSRHVPTMTPITSIRIELLPVFLGVFIARAFGPDPGCVRYLAVTLPHLYLHPVDAFHITPSALYVPTP